MQSFFKDNESTLDPKIAAGTEKYASDVVDNEKKSRGTPRLTQEDVDLARAEVKRWGGFTPVMGQFFPNPKAMRAAFPNTTRLGIQLELERRIHTQRANINGLNDSIAAGNRTANVIESLKAHASVHAADSEYWRLKALSLERQVADQHEVLVKVDRANQRLEKENAELKNGSRVAGATVDLNFVAGLSAERQARRALGAMNSVPGRDAVVFAGATRSDVIRTVWLWLSKEEAHPTVVVKGR